MRVMEKFDSRNSDHLMISEWLQRHLPEQYDQRLRQSLLLQRGKVGYDARHIQICDSLCGTGAFDACLLHVCNTGTLEKHTEYQPPH